MPTADVTRTATESSTESPVVKCWTLTLSMLGLHSVFGSTAEEREAAKRLRDALQRRTPEILRECAG